MKIFYSWQSDLPNRTNRGFIEKALTNAVKAIRNDESIAVEPVIDRDTLGVSGTPNIPQTILQKIDECDVFVCDISIINSGSKFRSMPNPNVLFELGYALKKLGWERIIMVMNEAFGKISKLPFDLEKRRTILYSLKKDSVVKIEERTKLAKQFENYIKLILKKNELESTQEIVPSIPLNKSSLYAYITSNSLVRKYDKQMAEMYGLPLDTTEDITLWLSEQAQGLGIRTVAELDKNIKTYGDLAIRMGYFQRPEKKVSAGYSISLVFEVLIAQMETVENIDKFYKSMKFSGGFPGKILLDNYEQASNWKNI